MWKELKSVWTEGRLHAGDGMLTSHTCFSYSNSDKRPALPREPQPPLDPNRFIFTSLQKCKLMVALPGFQF